MSQSVDTGKVFKRKVCCSYCNQDYFFTLRAIADNTELNCFGCGKIINMCDDDHRHLVAQVRETLDSLHP
jgi:hypothetical protein